jgi:haloalkane dehalogenase
MDRPIGVADFTPDPTLYPFESRWFQSSVGPIHYIDEGSGTPLLLLHGNPDWSFLYRKIMLGLRDRFRCVALDYPGFGMSVHPSGYGYTAEEHARVVLELVDELDLHGMLVMGQDWGGPIGLDVASRRPDRVAGLVMGNTWFWPAKERAFIVFSKLMGSPPLQWLIRQKNLFVKVLMRRSLQTRLTDREFAHYTDVVPTPESRTAIAVFPKQILDARPWMATLENRVADTLRDKPILLIHGLKDPVLAGDAIRARWRDSFSDPHEVLLDQAGHYIQEDDPEAIVAAILDRFGDVHPS